MDSSESVRIHRAELHLAVPFLLQVQIPWHRLYSPKARIKITMLQSTNQGLAEVSSNDVTLFPLKSIIAFNDSTSSQGFQNSNPQTAGRVCVLPARLCLTSQSLWRGNTKFFNSPPCDEDTGYCFKQSNEICGK